MRTVGEEGEQAPATDGGSKTSGMFVLCSFHVMMMPFHSWLHDVVLFYLFFNFCFPALGNCRRLSIFLVQSKARRGAKGIARS